ncbi:hypothetical protein [Flavobacterium sp. CLA17]|uniref:hypothetical protein n=1 Tax=Flavobacterium sp. CLA17 TaxID=2724135 RepID=UPI001491883C|nr:hypothetical protein [Flavobacterium sp. CLA17]QSB28415.1 hypothetical protein HAV12_006685 [Flavobacterium sp. CLA17]
MKDLIILPLFILIFACNSKNNNTELKLPKTTHLINIDEPEYNFKYPNSWEKKPSRIPNYIDIQSHAYANVEFHLNIVPDSLGGEKFINDIKSWENILKFETFEKQNKKYYKVKYETHGRPGICEQIYYVDHSNVYYLSFVYSEQATPKDKIKEGQEILKSFAVK